MDSTFPVCPRMTYSHQLPHSSESGNPDKLWILQVLLDSRFRGNEATRDNSGINLTHEIADVSASYKINPIANKEESG